MFHDLDSNAPLLGSYDLDRFVARGVRTMVLTTRDQIKDVADFNNQVFNANIHSTATARTPGSTGTFQSIAGWCAAQTQVNCFIEVGNEPDRVQEFYRTEPTKSPAGTNPDRYDGYWGPWQTRWRALDIVNDFNNNRRAQNQNLRLMIGLPTTGGNGFFNAGDYFTAFTEFFSHPSSSGSSRVGDTFDAVAVHTYANICFANYRVDPVDGQPKRLDGNSQGGGTPLHPVFRALDNSTRRVYVTEMNVNTGVGAFSGQGNGDPNGPGDDPGSQPYEYRRWNLIGKRLVTGLDAFDLRDGRIAGVMAFHSDYNPEFAPRFEVVNGSWRQVPKTVGPYNIDQNAGDWIGHRQMGLGTRGEECAIYQPYKNNR